MKSIGIFGIGSPFGADDIAYRVIQLLKQNLAHSNFKDQIKVEYYDRPHVYLLELINNFKEVHIIDAIVSGQAVGTLHRYEEITIFQENNCLLSSHGFGVADVLMLGKILHTLPEKIIIHGIEIENNSSTMGEMNKACHELVSRIMMELGNFNLDLK